MRQYILFSLLVYFLVLGNTVTLANDDFMSAANGKEAMTVTDSREPKVVVIGASYVKGLKSEKVAKYSVLVKGIGGEETKFTIKRFEKDVLSIKPRAVIIWGFINDIFRSERVDIDKTIIGIKANYTYMAEIAIKGGIVPIFATEITMAYPNNYIESITRVVGKIIGKESYQDYINSHVVNVNKWLKQYAKENNIKLLDFQSVLELEKDGARRSEYAVEDGSHITPAGYTALDIYMTDQLRDFD